MTFDRFPVRFAITLPLLAALCACGGGDSDSPAAASDPIDKWMGTYAYPCAIASGVFDTNTGTNVHWKRKLTMQSKVSSTKVLRSMQSDYHNSADCSDTARYTLTVTGNDDFFSVDGSVVIDGKSVDKITSSEGAPFPGVFSGASLEINGLKFTGNRYSRQTTGVAKDLFYIDTAGNLYAGDWTQPLDAQGYPTALSATPPTIRKIN